MKILDAFTLTNRKDMNEVPAFVYMLDESHHSQVAELQEYIVDSLEDKDLFYPLTDDEIENIVSGKGGLSIGTFVEDKLIGFKSAYFPRFREDNLGRDIGLPESEWMKVAHLEACFVHPHFQGNSLQIRMTDPILERVTALNRYRYIFSTATPENIPSAIDKLVHKLAIVDLKEKYNSGWRYVFFRDLYNEHKLNRDEAIPVPNTDIPRQVELINSGYRGLGYEKSSKGINILYTQV